MKSLFKWFAKSGAPAAPEPMVTEEAEALDLLRTQIERDVAGGFYDEDEILRSAAAGFEEILDAKLLRRQAQQYLRDALAHHSAEQRTWPEHTDCDRLDAAFEALEAEGVIARQNFSCCGTCGSSEIWDEVSAAEEAGASPRGYAFYHMQDTEAATEGGGLYLNYGACGEGEAAALEIAREIVARIEEHGLKTHWDGTWETRIGIDIDWKRRRGIA